MGEEGAELLKPYLPRLLVNWLADDPKASFQELEGTLVFVDISGFTKLSERLAKKGKVGAEELSGVIGSCFAQLLAVAYGNGGGLIKFGGDALLIFFTGPDHEARACRSAVGMRATLREIGRLETAGVRVNLRMSVGIHSGVFHFFLVGDSHHELIVTGPAASQTVLMEQTAEAGEIVVSPQTAAALPAGAVGLDKGPGGLLRRQPPGLSREVRDLHSEVRDVDLSSGVPLAVRDHLLGGGGGPEHRQVTVAFLHFHGTDEMVTSQGPEVVAKALDELVSGVQRVVEQHEVAFLATDIDKDGGKIIVSAGAPRSTGSDEERMLRTLRQIIEAEHALPLRIGVNRGPVFAGDIGPSYRRTYTVMGDAVNLAARLMAKAEPGQILVSLGVIERSRTAFQTKELEPFLVKGKAQPVRAAAVGPLVGTRSVESAELGPLVGRDLELRTLLEALDLSRQGVGTLIELVGDPGAGKSRLIEELRIRAQEFRCYTLICDQYESSTPYFPFRLLLRVVLDSPRDDREAGRRLTELVSTHAPELLPWLPLIAIPAGARVPTTPETEQLDEQFRRSRLHEAVGELLGRVLHEPTVTIFEDTHWMDEPSGDLLRHLTLGVVNHPWLFVTSRREQETGFLAGQGATSLHLKSLGPEDASTLAWAATEDLHLAPHEIDLLAERSGGNPLFLLELVSGAKAAGGVDALPDSVNALIMARIDRLSPMDRTRLRHAAVLGMAFREDVLTAVLPVDALDGDGAAWDRLSDFLQRDQRGVYRFRHGLIREVAYEGLPYRQRRELHARAGETIERSCDGRVDDEAEILSLHFFFAGQYEKAWRYSRTAGERAQTIYANVEAQDFYQRALNSARGAGVAPLDVATVWESLGDVRNRMGVYEAAAAAYREARRRLADPIPKARVRLKLAQVAGWLRGYSPALASIRRGLRELDEVAGIEAQKERARLMAWYARFRQEQGRHKQAITWCLRAIEAAEASEARDVLAIAYKVLDWAYVELGHPEEARYSEKALAIYEELGDLLEQGNVLNNMGVMAHWAGRWNDARHLYDQAKEAWKKTGDSVGVGFALSNIGAVLSEQGYLLEAEAMIREALRLWRAARYRGGVADAKGLLGRVAYRLARFDEAIQLLRDSREESREVGAEVSALAVDAWLAECFAFMEEPGKALEQANGALERARELGGAPHVPLLHRVRGYALMQLRELDAAGEAFQRSLEEARSRNALGDVAFTLSAMTRLCLVRGDPVPTEVKQESETLIARLGVVASPNVLLPVHVRVGALADSRE